MSDAKIWLVYCDEDQQYSVFVPYQQGMTAWQVLEHSGLREQVNLPEPIMMGIFGLKIEDPHSHVVAEGDRLEIYRPLTFNPKEVRRKRAERHPVGRFARGNQWRKQQKNTD